jgi:oligoribonuclease
VTCYNSGRFPPTNRYLSVKVPVVDRLVWIDCEMTGLDLVRDALIEVACLVTDAELNVLGDGVDVVIHAGDQVLDGMDEVVRTMHARSGLTEEVRAATVTVPEAERRVLDYIRSFVPEPRSVPLCGNSIATDRAFLARDMPELDAWLHYRMVDVSSIKELVRRWYPRAYFGKPAKGLAHRALADIKESIRELRFYRQAVFVPQPGPDVDEAKAIAADLAKADHEGLGDTPADHPISRPATE